MTTENRTELRLKEIEGRVETFERALDGGHLDGGDSEVFVSASLGDIPWLVSRIRALLRVRECAAKLAFHDTRSDQREGLSACLELDELVEALQELDVLESAAEDKP